MAAAAPIVATPAPSTPAAPPARTGEIRDSGATHREAVSASTWRAEGVVKVLGPVDAGAVELNGATSIRGRLTADRLRSRGTLEVGGAVVVAQSAVLEGDSRLTGGLRAGSLDARGSTDVGASLDVQGELAFTGHFDVQGDLRAATVRFDGRLTAGGTLTSTKVEGKLRNEGRVGAILAPTVTIDRHAPLFGPKGHLTVLRIEATDARLAGVRCEYLRADRITLGPDCHIARLDGTVVARHPSSRVGPESSSPRPYGLTR